MSIEVDQASPFACLGALIEVFAGVLGLGFRRHFKETSFKKDSGWLEFLVVRACQMHFQQLLFPFEGAARV